MNAAKLHDMFEKQSPNGIGAAIDLLRVESLANDAIKALANPIPGVNQQIPLPVSPRIQAGFTVKTGSLKLDTAAHTISLGVDIWLHIAGNPADLILTAAYSLNQQPLGIDIDQSLLTVSLNPSGTSTIAPTNTSVDPNADTRLVNAGYKTSTGAADWDRFNKEVYYPFLWNVAQGLVRSVIRSLPIPQPLVALGAIRPVIPIKASFIEDYLVVWSDRATVALPDCGASPSPLPTPQGTWRVRPGSPPPSSPFDTQRPPFALYFAGGPILNWHSGVLKPAVMVSQSGGTVIGWRFDAVIGLDTLLVELVPALNGGSIQASAGLKVVGVASAWMNLPCGPVGLVSASIQGDASAQGSLSVAYDNAAHTVDAKFTVQGAIDPKSVVISTGGIFGSILGDLVNWLVHLGVINIGTKFGERGDTVIWDGGRINATTAGALFDPRMRVGNGSALIGLFEHKPELR